jgi:hypothetical protein
MKTREHIINHPSQLNSLSVLPLAKLPGMGTIRLTGTFKDHPQRAELEDRLNRQYRACGCATSAQFLLVGAVGSIVVAAFMNVRDAWSLSTSAAVVVGVSIVALAAGKLVGLMQANRRLKETVAEIQRLWIPEKGRVEENAICG